MIRSTKLTPPPPVPPRPSKTIVAEALAKSRRLSPIRALYATQPLSPTNITPPKPVVPVRSAPPPPAIKPKPLGSVHQVAQPQVPHVQAPQVQVPKVQAPQVQGPQVQAPQWQQVQAPQVHIPQVQAPHRQVPQVQAPQIQTPQVHTPKTQTPEVQAPKAQVPEVQIPKVQVPQVQVVKSYSCVTNNPKDTRIIRSASATNTRTVVYQSSNVHQSPNLKTSRIDVNLAKPKITEPSEPNPIDKVIDVLVNDSKIIVQSSDKTTIIVSNPTKPGDNDDDDNNNASDNNNACVNNSCDKKVQFDDKINHEILISELQNMKDEQDRLLKRQRKAPADIYDCCDNDSVNSGNSEGSRIQHSDWIEVANNGEQVRLSSCQIYIDTNCAGGGDGSADESSKSSSFSSSSSRKLTQRVPSMSSLHGLPPLPKSLSGFNLLDNNISGGGHHRVETPRGTYRVPASPGPQTPSRAGSSRGTTPPTPGSGSGSGHVVYPPHPRVNGNGEIPRGRKITTLDTQLAVLRREMYGLRQLDLSLLSQLYSLNEAIQDFRQMLQDQEDSALSPNSPSPSPSSGDEGDEFYSPAPMRYKPAPPAPPLRRTSNSSSANSSEYGTV